MGNRGAIGGKTGKTVVLPGFCKIESGGGNGGVPPCIGGASEKHLDKLSETLCCKCF